MLIRYKMRWLLTTTLLNTQKPMLPLDNVVMDQVLGVGLYISIVLTNSSDLSVSPTITYNKVSDSTTPI